jgi:hypothetical protein
MSVYVNKRLVEQHHQEMQREREAQRLVEVSMSAPHSRSVERPNINALQNALSTLGHSLALRGSWLPRHQAKLVRAANCDVVAPECC